LLRNSLVNQEKGFFIKFFSILLSYLAFFRKFFLVDLNYR
jgi:hypothetical protein